MKIPTFIVNMFGGFIGILITGALIIGLGYVFTGKDCCMCGTVELDCCPCPNTDILDEVNDYHGYKASSSGSWLWMCDDYLRVKNITDVECFE